MLIFQWGKWDMFLGEEWLILFLYYTVRKNCQFFAKSNEKSGSRHQVPWTAESCHLMTIFENFRSSALGTLQKDQTNELEVLKWLLTMIKN